MRRGSLTVESVGLTRRHSLIHGGGGGVSGPSCAHVLTRHERLVRSLLPGHTFRGIVLLDLPRDFLGFNTKEDIP
jgi:hypothetical protein